jgi:hypothetical protein
MFSLYLLRSSTMIVAMVFQLAAPQVLQAQKNERKSRDSLLSRVPRIEYDGCLGVTLAGRSRTTTTIRWSWDPCGYAIPVSRNASVRDFMLTVSGILGVRPKVDNLAEVRLSYRSGPTEKVESGLFASEAWQRNKSVGDIGQIVLQSTACARPGRHEKVVYAVCEHAACRSMVTWRPGETGVEFATRIGATPEWSSVQDVWVLRRTGQAGEGDYSPMQFQDISELKNLTVEAFDAFVFKSKSPSEERVFVLGEAHEFGVKRVSVAPIRWQDGYAPLGYPVCTADVLIVHPDGVVDKAKRPFPDKAIRAGDILFYPPYVSCETFGK